jgi:hypothetical protein
MNKFFSHQVVYVKSLLCFFFILDTHESSAFVKDNQRNDALVAEISFVVGILMAMLVCGVIYYRRLQVSKQLNNRHSNPRDISLDSDVYILKEEETKGNHTFDSLPFLFPLVFYLCYYLLFL